MAVERNQMEFVQINEEDLLNIKIIENVAIQTFFESESSEDEMKQIELLKQGVQIGYQCYKLNPTFKNAQNVSMCCLRLAELQKKNLEEKLKHVQMAAEYFENTLIHLSEKSSLTHQFELLHLKGRLALMVATLPVEAHFRQNFLKKISKYTLKDAASCFENAEEAYSGDIENQYYLAHCYELLKEYDSALMWFYEVTTNPALTQSEKKIKEKAMNKLPEEWRL